MKAVGISDIGRCRKNNEDAYYLSEADAPLQYLYIVADGMGGCNAGEVASSNAIAAFLEYVKTHSSTQEMMDLLAGGFQAANKAVFDKSNSALEFAEMGTTMVAVVIDKKRAYVAHVGDSRAYLMQKGILRQVTTDHSYVMELVKTGTITKQEAATHPKRNVITRAIGIKDTVETDMTVLDIEKGDLILLCTDGLSNMITEDDLTQMLREKLSIRKKAERLVETANLRGGYDNISLILIEI